MAYPGEIIAGMYQIVDEIGKGGVGVIYRAYHLNLQKYVVLKKMKDHFVGVLEARAEVDILKSLHHSNLPQVYDFIHMDGDIYTVMDFIEGHDLKYYIDRGYYFDEKTLWLWLEQLCEVLEYLHNHKILHLDIKPANIMLTPEGKLYLIDFNISLSGETNALNGISEYYAAPEQYRKWKALTCNHSDREGSLDERTDLYSLGATFYHMMTGRMPTVNLTLLIPITGFQLNYTENLVAVIDKMMKPQKAYRYHSAKKVLDVIKKNQRTKEEKRTLNIVFFGMMVGIIILLVTIGVVIYRSHFHVNSKERAMILQQQESLIQLYNAGEYESAYYEGLMLLNKNSHILEKSEELEGDVLKILTDCCIEIELYEDALRYAEQLLDIEEKAEYYSQAAVSAAYMGDYSQAEAYLFKAKQYQGSTEEIIKSQAEIRASQKNYADAIEIYRSLPDSGSNTIILRKIAILALKEAENDPAYLDISIDCYEQMIAHNEESYSDRMNLVTAYLKCNMKGKALTTLQEMEVLYSGKYEVFARAAVLRYNMEIEKAPAERDFSRIRKEAEKAIQLYVSVSYNTDDELIDGLKQLLETMPQ